MSAPSDGQYRQSGAAGAVCLDLGEDLEVLREVIEAAFLRCDQLSSRSVLDRGSAIHCSMVAEELCQRGFGGSFGRMIAWWQGARLDAAGVAARGKRPKQRAP